jgi:hypothetical protein
VDSTHTRGVAFVGFGSIEAKKSVEVGGLTG